MRAFGPWDPQYIKVTGPRGAYGVIKSPETLDLETCRTWEFPGADICWPEKLPSGASGIAYYTKCKFSSDSNGILRRMETRIL